MDSYQRAGRAFEAAYRKQLQAQDTQRRQSQEDEAVFGDYVRESTNFEAGQPFTPPPGQADEAKPFDQTMDDQVDKVEGVKKTLLSEARQRANAIAPADY